MQQKIVPLLVPPLRKSQPEAIEPYATKKRGMAVLTTPLLNKGSAFTVEEREALSLNGLLPPVISTLESQVGSAYLQYQRLPDALGKNIYLTALHDRNEVLFFRLFSEHLREMIPIVNDRTVGLAMEQYHHECRRPRGVYLSINEPNGIEAAFGNLGAGPDDIDLILATDAEQIFGIGDWGVGGIEVAIGKLAIYTAAGGINPARVIPVMLDVGTDRECLRDDPMYPGNRHARVRGASLRFEFKGKSGLHHRVDLHDRKLARLVALCQDLPGQHLFSYLDDDGAAVPIDSADVNAYIREISGADFTAKDFRTWLGTVHCAQWLLEHPAETEGERSKNAVEAVKFTASHLRNTPAVCRKCYIHPAVFERYLETGRLAPSKSRRKSQLHPEERFAVDLLRYSRKDA